jgi:hypothetical protein
MASSSSSSSSSGEQAPAATATSINFSAAQFEQLLNVIREGPQTQRTPVPETPASIDTRYKVNWTHCPALDLGKGGELDFWFISLEARLRAAQIPENAWADKFMQCPMVDEAVKMRILGLADLTYPKIRASILKEHGPIDPVNFHGGLCSR